MLGVNPWKLMAWLGHKSITQTHRYVHVAGNHMRPIPEKMLDAGEEERDPDRRIIRMLGARVFNHGTLYGTKENAGCQPGVIFDVSESGRRDLNPRRRPWQGENEL